MVRCLCFLCCEVVVVVAWRLCDLWLGDCVVVVFFVFLSFG